METKNYQPSWKIRRFFMFWIILFCMGVVGYILYKSMDSSVADSAMTMAFFIIGSTISSYVFGATMEDMTKLKEGLS